VNPRRATENGRASNDTVTEAKRDYSVTKLACSASSPTASKRLTDFSQSERGRRHRLAPAHQGDRARRALTPVTENARVLRGVDALTTVNPETTVNSCSLAQSRLRREQKKRRPSFLPLEISEGRLPDPATFAEAPVTPLKSAPCQSDRVGQVVCVRGATWAVLEIGGIPCPQKSGEQRTSTAERLRGVRAANRGRAQGEDQRVEGRRTRAAARQAQPQTEGRDELDLLARREAAVDREAVLLDARVAARYAPPCAPRGLRPPTGMRIGQLNPRHATAVRAFQRLREPLAILLAASVEPKRLLVEVRV
jgi:hypothetical protein